MIRLKRNTACSGVQFLVVELNAFITGLEHLFQLHPKLLPKLLGVCTGIKFLQRFFQLIQISIGSHNMITAYT